MASDMAVALARATLDGHTYFAHNSNVPRGQTPALVRTEGRNHAPDEIVRATHLTLPQARHTFGVLAGRSGSVPGYQHGVNEMGVAAGCTPVHTRLLNDSPCLTGPDLVRFALERACTALQAVEVVTDLIGRHGQGPFVGEGEDTPDSALLIADYREAYVLEATGRHWALASIGSVRAVSNACFLHQDWDRISRGLSDLAIQRGWWPEDGCKLDFARAMGLPGADVAPALRRWGQATMQLEQHSGAIDAPFLRHLLHSQSDAVRSSLEMALRFETAASLIVRLGPEPASLPVAWYAYGPPPACIYVPVLPVAELPAAFADASDNGSALWRLLGTWYDDSSEDPQTRTTVLCRLAKLQQQIDEHAHEFLADAERLHCRGQTDELRRLASVFMQQTFTRFEELTGSLQRRWEPAGADSEAEAVLPGAEL
jgi:dipeptidase